MPNNLMFFSTPTVNRGHPVNSGLMEWWPLTETAGKINKNVAGVRSGTSSLNYVRTTGKYGKALNFNGSTDYFGIGNYASVPIITFSFWTKPTVFISDIRLVSAPDGTVFSLRFNSAGILEAWIPPTWYTLLCPALVNDWNHVVFIITSTFVAAYVNGVGGDTTSIGSITLGNLAFGVPMAGSWGNWFTGLIQNIRIYNRVLTSDEVRVLYLNPFAGILTSTRGTIFLPSASTLKTYNGLSQGSIKTMNAVAIASVKTVNGLA